MSIDKLDLQSPDLVNANFQKLAELFPNCVTESSDGKAIDFDLLKQELNHAVVDGNKERYRLEWPGKKEAIVTANLPTNKTLRPIREDSVDFDNTENLYIEGDNLEVLKLLQESYLGKVKMIYIDPPYNTGKDFVYKDNFARDAQEELKESGQRNEYNQRLVANPETSGRYHSDWLSMMYPRLKLARNLLKDDGVIFISIDDNEVDNLRKLCDEIFGERNFLSQFIWTGKSGSEDDGNIRNNHEYCISFCKSILHFEVGLDIKVDDNFPLYDEARGERYKRQLLRKWGDNSKRDDRPNLFYPIKDDAGNDFYPTLPDGKDGCWRWSKVKMNQAIQAGYVEFDNNRNGQFEAYEKIFESDESRKTKKFQSILSNTSSTSNGTKEVKELFIDKVFDRPKPTEFISYLSRIANINIDGLVLDFFSGSATTGHAVMRINAQDKGGRKYIMVQLPESTEDDSEAYKAGYKNICEIGKERIRRAGNKIKEETGADIDYGFRVYRLDESNMQDVYYKPQDYKQGALDLFADNVKPDRTPDDLLAQVMLDWGLPLSYKIERVKIAGKDVFKVAQDSLLACFDKGLDEAFAKEIAKEKPLRVVFRDNGFVNDTAKENVKQLLKQLSPETEMKVI